MEVFLEKTSTSYLNASKILEFLFSSISMFLIIILLPPSCLLCTIRRERSSFHYQILIWITIFLVVSALPSFFQFFLLFLDNFFPSKKDALTPTPEEILTFPIVYPLWFRFLSAFLCQTSQSMRNAGGAMINVWTTILTMNTKFLVQNPLRPASRHWPLYYGACCLICAAFVIISAVSFSATTLFKFMVDAEVAVVTKDDSVFKSFYPEPTVCEIDFMAPGGAVINFLTGAFYSILIVPKIFFIVTTDITIRHGIPDSTKSRTVFFRRMIFVVLIIAIFQALKILHRIFYTLTFFYSYIFLAVETVLKVLSLGTISGVFNMSYFNTRVLEISWTFVPLNFIDFVANSWTYAQPIFFATVLLYTDENYFQTWGDILVCKIAPLHEDFKIPENDIELEKYEKFELSKKLKNNSFLTENLLSEQDNFENLDESFRVLIDPFGKTQNRNIDKSEFFIRRDFVNCVFFGVCNSIFESKTESKAIFVEKAMQIEEKYAIGKENFSEIKKSRVYNPTTKHSITIEEYYPQIFREIRRIFGISDEEFAKSLNPQTVTQELIEKHFSERTTGSFFCLSADSKFLIKTIKRKEKKMLEKNIERYFQHFDKNRETLIAPILGFFDLEMNYKFNVTFIIMKNVFFHEKISKISKKFDLKGSWVNRSISRKHRRIPKVFRNYLLLDQDLKEDISVGENEFNKLKNQISIDAEFLLSTKAMDYSLLLGIRVLGKDEISNVGKDENKPFHKQIDGGILTDDKKKILYLGIADTLTPYSPKKKIENFCKTFFCCKSPKGISSVDPKLYADRFQRNVTMKFIGGSGM